MVRLGLCCSFMEFPIKYRTTTARYLTTLRDKGKNPREYISELIAINISSLEKSIDYCSKEKIGSFRINSGFYPVCTHPDFSYALEDLPNHSFLMDRLQKIKKLAKAHNIRLTFHPDQFVVLNSPKEDVLTHSIAELEYHGALAELVGADVINIHGGGGYGDKKNALDRFIKGFQKLSTRVQRLLTVENDDCTYTPQDLLPICHQLKIPLVYDVHHHRCLPDEFTISEVTHEAMKTWDREPLVHVSSPLDGWKSKNPKPHADYIDAIDVPAIWKGINVLTIDVEAKAKELAVLKLRKELSEIGWSF